MTKAGELRGTPFIYSHLDVLFLTTPLSQQAIPHLDSKCKYIKGVPLDNCGDLDVFGYVQNNPINFTDPTGLANSEMIWSGIGEMAGGAAGVVGAAYVTAQSGGTLAPLTVPAAIASGAVLGHGAASFWTGVIQDKNINIPSTSLTYQASKLAVCHETADAIDGGVDMLLQFGMMKAHPPTSVLESSYEALQLTNNASKVVPILNGVKK